MDNVIVIQPPTTVIGVMVTASDSYSMEMEGRVRVRIPMEPK